MSKRPPLIVGNWKMNGRAADLGEILAVAEGLARLRPGLAEAALCPPFPLLGLYAAPAAAARLALGAQDVDHREDGAVTGAVSAAMLADLGAAYVIVGHSERREGFGETDALVRAKAEAAIAAGLTAIVCVGETLAERDAGLAGSRVAAQVAGSLPDADGGTLVIAYEPIWAIGTGRTPTEDEIIAVHAEVRAAAARRGAGDVRVLYGGSVKPGNARTLLALDGVDGALVGGASLKAADFLAIINALPALS